MSVDSPNERAENARNREGSSNDERCAELAGPKTIVADPVAPSDTHRPIHRRHHGPRHGLHTGEPSHFAGKIRVGLCDILPTEPETLPVDRRLRGRIGRIANIGARFRPANRRFQISDFPGRRIHRGGHRYLRPLARRFRGVRAGMFLFVRRSFSGRGLTVAPSRSRARRAGL